MHLSEEGIGIPLEEDFVKKEPGIFGHVMLPLTPMQEKTPPGVDGHHLYAA